MAKVADGSLTGLRPPAPGGPAGPQPSVKEWLGVWARAGTTAAVEQADALVGAAGSVPERIETLRSALAAIGDPMPLTDYGAAGQVGSEGDAPVSQRMVPSGRDLELARRLLEPGAAAPFSEELSRLEHEQLAASRTSPGSADSTYIQALWQRHRNIVEDRSIFDAMRDRTDWAALRPSQVAAMVLAERRGRQVAAAERDALIDLLRGKWSHWADGYPIHDVRVNGLIEKVHDFLRHRMNLTVNVELKSIQAVLSDNQIALKNVWTTKLDTGYPYKNMRGKVEELLGYSATVKRNTNAGGIYGDPQAKASGNDFSPDGSDRLELPKYAALMSPLRPEGILATMGGANVVFHLKAEVRDRATFTPKDSFAPKLEGAGGVTGPNDLFPLLVHGNEMEIRLAFAKATNFAYDEGVLRAKDSGDLPRCFWYFEAQIHGDLTWKDIDRVVLVWRVTPATFKRLEKCSSILLNSKPRTATISV
ncbi:hypothetical protein [Actinoallomurus acaciae]|uniref:Uncharacterized protein n=1 Tax=Actinoallomurus acaciae TaxID=502577 RepID=A0ABV5YIG0_9ACTN